jgi:hypothetical protein
VSVRVGSFAEQCKAEQQCTQQEPGRADALPSDLAAFVVRRHRVEHGG